MIVEYVRTDGDDYDKYEDENDADYDKNDYNDRIYERKETLQSEISATFTESNSLCYGKTRKNMQRSNSSLFLLFWRHIALNLLKNWFDYSRLIH